MIRVVMLALALMVPVRALGQPVPVRSGEHAGFSRLVFLFGDVPDWQLGRVDGGYELRLQGAARDFDLARVFDLIPRTRISSVLSGPDGRIILPVDCECHANAFEIPAGLVVDIKDGAPAPTGRYDKWLPQTAPGQSGTALVGDIGKRPETDRERGLTSIAAFPPLPLPLEYRPRRTALAWRDSLALSLPSRDTGGSARPTPPDDGQQVADIRRELLLQISRAAAQGLVAPDLGTNEIPQAEDEGPPLARDRPPVRREIAAPVPAQGADDPDPPALEPIAGVVIETATDRGELRPRPAEQLTAEGGKCLVPGILDVSGWGEPPDGGSSLSRYRSGIVGEFDEANPESILALAKNYIYLTFGSEARALLGAFSTEIDDAALLLVLADIMDELPAGPPFVLADQLECESESALWALLADPAPRRGEHVAVNAVVRAFAALPLHLRRHLAARVVGRLLRIGDGDAAALIRDSVDRAPGDHGPALEMANAEIALDRGDANAGAAHFSKVVAGGGPMAPQALVRLIDTKLDSSATVAPGLIDTAAAMAFEARGTPVGDELTRVRLRAMGHDGQILQALGEIPATPENEKTAKWAAGLRLELLGLATRQAPDVTFLRAVLTQSALLDPGTQATPIRRAVAGRLIDLGLPDDARRILSQGHSSSAPEDRKIIARGLIAQGQGDLALGYLAGLDDTEATRLRADSQALAGKFDLAADTYRSLDDNVARARAAWRGGILPVVVDLGPERQRAAAIIATTRLTTVPNDTNSPFSLALAGELVQQSRRTREVIDALFSPPTP